MTFIPEVLTETDTNNSVNTTLSTSPYTYTGTSTDTTGYTTITLTIQSTVDSSSCGIDILFSDDNSTFNTYYSDTYFAPNVFTKNYLVIKKYYKISYVSSASATVTITSRLSTNTYSNNIQNPSITAFNNSQENTIDAFGKLRVSNPNTLLQINFPPLSTGSSTFLSNNLQICSASSGFTGTYQKSTLIVNGNAPGYYISQSRNYANYQVGNSLLFLGSGVLDPGNSNFTTRIGYFDNQTPLANPLVVRSGLYFQCSSGVVSVNITTYNGSSSSTTSISQSSWNIDTMDGNASSGLNLNFTKAQSFVIDIDSLIVGRVRFGFYAYGRIQYCHEVININNLTLPYTVSLNLPICYSIHSTATSVSSTTFTQISSTVISEGFYSPIGKNFSSNFSLNMAANDNGEKSAFAIRGGGNNYYHQKISFYSLFFMNAGTTDTTYFRLRLYPAGTSPGTLSWYDIDTNYSVCQFSNITGFTTTNSIILYQAAFTGNGGSSSEVNLKNIFLTANATNTSDILVLTFQRPNANANTAILTGILNCEEFT